MVAHYPFQMERPTGALGGGPGSQFDAVSYTHLTLPTIYSV